MILRRSIQSIGDVVDWGLCVGCGACVDACDQGGIELVNIPGAGIRPLFRTPECASCEPCLAVCPGYTVEGRIETTPDKAWVGDTDRVGPVLEVWEGHASDDAIRHAASSGGIVTALAAYCLEKEAMAFVLHSGMDAREPSRNRTVQSRTREELIERAGSRYAPASPCDKLRLIEESDAPCVFIGKPCDTAAVAMARHRRPALDRNLGLVVSFFCAGAPGSQGTLDLARELGIEPGDVGEVRYRGRGWPGSFTVTTADGERSRSRSYEQSWSYLQQYRPFRCHLCPDGLGQVADLSCGDAWHAYRDDGNPGRSLILVRTERGREILGRAMAAGFIDAVPAEPAVLLDAQQNLINRKQHLWGRLLAMRLLGIPVPRFPGFALWSNWTRLPWQQRIRSVAGTARRILARGLWRRRPPRERAASPAAAEWRTEQL